MRCGFDHESTGRQFDGCVATLGMLFTPLRPFHKAVKFGTDYCVLATDALCSKEVTVRPVYALVMRNGLE